MYVSLNSDLYIGSFSAYHRITICWYISSKYVIKNVK